MNITLFQQDIAWEAPLRNHEQVSRLLDTLRQPTDIIVLPETFNTGFSERMAQMADDGSTLRFAQQMAARHNALFVATWISLNDEGRAVNRMHLVRPDGTYDYYDKGHTFRMSCESSQIERGTRRLTVDWRGIRIRPAVCYDLRFPTWLRNTTVGLGHDELQRLERRQLQSHGAPGERYLDYDLLIVSANWAASRSHAWQTLLRARAIENLCYVAGVNRVGTDGAEIPYSGNSALVDFRGIAVAEATPGEQQLVTAAIDPQALETFRRHWPLYLDFD